MTTRPGGKALLTELYADYFKRGELVAADVDPLAVAGALRALGPVGFRGGAVLPDPPVAGSAHTYAPRTREMDLRAVRFWI
jgi:hypothetical protein